MQTKDYQCKDTMSEIGGKQFLTVQLETKEFGKLESRMVARVINEKTADSIIWNSLADEIIDEYEDRLTLLRSKPI